MYIIILRTNIFKSSIQIYEFQTILQDSQYLIPEEHMIIRDISNDPNRELIQDYMSILTGGRTVCYTNFKE